MKEKRSGGGKKERNQGGKKAGKDAGIGDHAGLLGDGHLPLCGHSFALITLVGLSFPSHEAVRRAVRRGLLSEESSVGPQWFTVSGLGALHFRPYLPPTHESTAFLFFLRFSASPHFSLATLMLF